MTPATVAPASSLATAVACAALPGTTTVIGVPAAPCCAATMGSHEARLSVPSRCSAMMRMPAIVLDDPRLIAERLDEIARDIGGRAGQLARLFALFGDVEVDDLEPRAGAARGGAHRPDLLLFRRHDALERGVAELIDAALDGEHRRQRHGDPLEPAAFQLTLDPKPAVLHLHV